MWVDEPAPQRRTIGRTQDSDLSGGTASWRKCLTRATEAARALATSLGLIVARATHGPTSGNNRWRLQQRPDDGSDREDEGQAPNPGSEVTISATPPASKTADPIPSVDARPIEPTISRVAGHDRRAHEMLGEPLGPLDRAPTAPLELAGLLEAGLTVQQIDFLVFQRWAIGGPRFPHTIRLSWEGERRGLLYRLSRR